MSQFTGHEGELYAFNFFIKQFFLFVYQKEIHIVQVVHLQMHQSQSVFSQVYCSQ